ncbi:hypothetical protein Pcinc_043161 [Petrolisthes cinctipes]|uniref:Uncharacterized protein n=1 Tax=Petrolisthes cinctipes TaxID=88211 RepID=A0AAE1EGH1_PETCI|nr:hypothetical protein Pcinc_043161 [Petrolisthes cinctipes]
MVTGREEDSEAKGETGSEEGSETEGMTGGEEGKTGGEECKTGGEEVKTGVKASHKPVEGRGYGCDREVRQGNKEKRRGRDVREEERQGGESRGVAWM